MDIKLIIGYGGVLGQYLPKQESGKLKEWFWTYRVDNIDQSTRTAYFLFKAIALLKNDRKIKKGDLLVRLWGKIDSSNVELVKELGIKDFVEIEGYKSKNESYDRLSKCDILFLPLESSCKDQKPLFIPGKLFEYLKLAKPILALTEESDCKEIIEKSDIGICIEPKDIDKIATELLDLISNKNDRIGKIIPNKEYIAKFAFKEKAKELARVFDELL